VATRVKEHFRFEDLGKWDEILSLMKLFLALYKS